MPDKTLIFRISNMPEFEGLLKKADEEAKQLAATMDSIRNYEFVLKATEYEGLPKPDGGEWI